MSGVMGGSNNTGKMRVLIPINTYKVCDFNGIIS